jgi:UTP---glucose-1-phosphate uridylyltransferase
MLEQLALQLAQCSSIASKIEALAAYPVVKEFLEQSTPLQKFISKASSEHNLIVLATVAAGQGERLFSECSEGQLVALVEQLLPVERFYSSMGGIVGYQARMLQLLAGHAPVSANRPTYLPPEGIDLGQETLEVRRAIIDGIEMLSSLAEIYPLGGAADRLRLYDANTGLPLPAARLPFLGKTLLEGLISDLQSREYLHYKLKNGQLITPVAIMTSQEKNNHQHVLDICEEAGWFGRPVESFKFFCQPLVPTVGKQGEWALQGPQQLLMKPGGHGVIWRLAREEKVFDWLFAWGRKKALVRQVNNPVANTDYGLLAFTGLGCAQDKWFGFASCPRQVKASEGINVLLQTKTSLGYSYTLTNIEYCDFKKYGIIDQPEKPGSPYSQFPSNTNILFVDLETVLQATERCPIPGILVNLKKVTYLTSKGQKKEEEAARLESTMQNIADFLEEHFAEELSSNKRQLKTFLTYNHRRKTISAAKREFALGASLLETPEGCFLDILHNSRDLLVNKCHFQVPAMSDALHFFEKGPSFIFLYHPALGPLYSVIAQKLRGGRLHAGSELQLQISEIDSENLDLDGSLLIQADHILGHLDAQGKWVYSEKCGRCTLHNITICNKGIDHEMPNVFWRNEIARQEVCQIILRGRSEFFASNITLRGDHFIEVPDGFRCTATEVRGEVHLSFEKIEAPSWHWRYRVLEDQTISLTKVM